MAARTPDISALGGARLATKHALRLAVGIATAGRPEILRETVAELTKQTRVADAIVVCAPAAADLAGVEAAHPRLTTMLGPRGLTRQRNAILRALENCDVVVFLDDDFLPERDFLAAVEAVFAAHGEVVMVTGRVVADGICGPGLSMAEARAHLAAAGPGGDGIAEVYNGYGCNMAVRLAPVRNHAVFFDEALPLYGWLEDVDFSRRLAHHGSIVRAEAAIGVHLGVKSGRQSGRRLGYSQIANPLYLARKGSCSWRKALIQASRNLAANLAGVVRPEPYVDRRGRALGNGRAVLDLVTGRLEPARALEL